MVETNKERDIAYDKISFSPDMNLETEEWMGGEEEESSSQPR